MSGLQRLDLPLEIFGQQPGLNGLYTQICHCYPVSDASTHSTITERLQTGLGKLTASFPWIAGQTINESGTFKIKDFEKTPRLIVKDLRNDSSMPTYNALKKAEFPFSMLDENIICPRNTLPGMSNDSTSPVFLVQATFITDGLLLCFVGEHNCMDMTGQGHIIYLFSKACRNESFTDEELRTGNLDRRNIIPLLDDSYTPGPELDRQIIKPLPKRACKGVGEIAATRPVIPKSIWAYFDFSSASLAKLKSLAMETKPSGAGFVSTDDALTAFIWQGVSRARLARLRPTKKSTCARAIDPRRYLNIPMTYPGLVQNMAYNDSTLQEVAGESLGVIAAQLRSAVDPKTSNIAHRTSALATLLSQVEDKSHINVTANMDFSSDIMLSSWAKVNSYDLDFDLGLGKPEAVRRPMFTGVESLIYLMPKRRDGESAAGICLREEDMDRLRNDEEFIKYGTYIG
ncbi:putative trichothecene 3-O-acetyltransferase [Lindgomyces ingoldianus]|uniref:Trichothecene 3-O-acetyltransferase n=1 Tax=Lindgomyces ingoldianus TaxID=673940 RepID=A0ACB6RBH7_9PLEO|nr:putative trichothecene 3-O-acetyltransferase [Lindgomyces ingoldianus]KAF2475872.1 putative trichothecene 3-O-acetyltransferase [Lindgomyces ingoldianus]